MKLRNNKAFRYGATRCNRVSALYPPIAFPNMTYIVQFDCEIINLIKTLPLKTVYNIEYSRQVNNSAILLIENTFFAAYSNINPLISSWGYKHI